MTMKKLLGIMVLGLLLMNPKHSLAEMFFGSGEYKHPYNF
jgi:hypothetical protein